MLAIQSLVAKKLQLPTLIFDEIDTGISGEAAKQVGIIMKEMSVEHQLIVVTHQPQIAAKADHHYFVYKEKKNDRIAAAVNVLNTKERIMAIAQMMGGTKPTEASILNATEMIHQNE
jgi:DNA repair protein RecN (Recombination protein N)